MRKSVYVRKYHIMKVIFTVTKKCQLTIKNRQKVLEIFEFIGKIITKKINKDLKGMIIINLIMEKIFEMMNIEFESTIPTK